MPELPEVETVKKVLEDNFLNKTFSYVDIFYNKILENIDENDFKEKIKNQKIISFSRKGKFIIFNLSNGYLIFHLRMEGKFKFNVEIDKHSHLVFHFKDSFPLIYHDVRKFGRLYYFNLDDDIYNLKPLVSLGKEPFEIDDISYLKDKFQKINKPIKEVLLDQSIMAGIGNIYADEILFKSKIHPLTKAKDLSGNDLNNIIINSKEILLKAIENKGSTIKSFQYQHNQNGSYQEFLNVYGRKNMPCKICNTLIKKINVAGRGTSYCPKCQGERSC